MTQSFTDRRSFVLGMAGLAGTAALGLPRTARAATPAMISEAIHLGLYMPLYAAMNGGFFEKHGLTPDLKTAGGIAQPVPALLSNAADFAVTGTGMSINATVEGAQMVNIAKIAGMISVWVVAKQGTSFNGPEDFAGKTIATLKFPSNTYTTPFYAMQKAGMDPEADVTWLQLPFGAQLQAVADGRADFATVFEWDASIGATQFDLEVVYSLGEALGPAVFSSTFVTKDFLDANPDAVQAYCNAIAEAEKQLHEDEQVFVDVATKEFPQVDPAVIAAARARFFGDVPLVPRNPVITEQEWRTLVEHEAGAGTLRADLPYEQMVDSSFAEKASQEFGLA
ncbi:ABC transporter substrate-binding protein [Tropicimonas sediminicola]|uniref:NitT/TauT family transport system substrate-binding protein n=1 Tax=Tropicimonas sediminicola TaxID=1031541 RepID=A0A239LRT0_9RHOB|nr:ABC transporter substrate-binding protein [Tropicimonas sediminicola]SNT32399.1 NitT/TauT family transport system substrate-binding protein [Tropicimonas sediminicola]